MSDTGKIIPSVERGGILLPWRLVAVLLLSGLVPLWLFTAKAMHVANTVDSLVEIQAEQQRQLALHGERLAAVEGKKP